MNQPTVETEKTVGAVPANGLWEFVADLHGPRVFFRERPDRRYVVYARWSVGGRQQWRSLRVRVRPVDRFGRPGPRRRDLERQAQQAAASFYTQLVTGEHTPAVPKIKPAALTLGETRNVLCNAQRGKYPRDTLHRRDVLRSLSTASRVWGSDKAWNDVKAADLRQLVRAELERHTKAGRTGIGGTEGTLKNILSIAAWLRDEVAIDATACVGRRDWRQWLRQEWSMLRDGEAEPTPHRPRHTLDQMRAILSVAGAVDPRFDLLLAVGAELRLGQVAKCRRSHLDLKSGVLHVPGRGHKRGADVELTAGQLAAVQTALAGYLAPLEATGEDYPLFPRGQMPGGRSGRGVATVERHLRAAPAGKTAIRKWWIEAEKLANVDSVKGRGAYGVRRAAVDAAKALGISREGLMAHGGWTDTQMPDRVYALASQDVHRKEAAVVRAKIRGETES